MLHTVFSQQKNRKKLYLFYGCQVKLAQEYKSLMHTMCAAVASMFIP